MELLLELQLQLEEEEEEEEAAVEIYSLLRIQTNCRHKRQLINTDFFFFFFSKKRVRGASLLWAPLGFSCPLAPKLVKQKERLS